MRDAEVISKQRDGGPLKIGFNVDQPDEPDTDRIEGGSTARFEKFDTSKNVSKKASR